MNYILRKKNVYVKTKQTKAMTCPRNMLAASDRAGVENAQNEHRTWGVDFSLMPETPGTLHFCKAENPVELSEERESLTTCTSSSCASSSNNQGWILILFLLTFIVYQN